MTPCSSVEFHRRFGGMCSLRLLFEDQTKEDNTVWYVTCLLTLRVRCWRQRPSVRDVGKLLAGYTATHPKNNTLHCHRCENLKSKTLRLRYRAQQFMLLWETVAVYCDNHTKHIHIVTWKARALLGNGPVKTPRPNTHKATIEKSPFLCNDV
jgi:hypothetical protein